MRSAGLSRVTLAWNWKTALFSGVYRGFGFTAATWGFGPAEAARAGALECALFSVLAGFTGAAIQQLRNARPAWLTAGVVLVGIPGVLHTAEWLLHRAFESAGRDRGVAVSMAMTALAELFSWYAMKEGAMLAGREGGTLWADMGRVPSLAGGFVLWVAGVKRPSR